MSSCQKKSQISTRHSNSTAVIPDEETYESTPNIFLPHFIGNPPIFPTSFFLETHQNGSLQYYIGNNREILV